MNKRVLILLLVVLSGLIVVGCGPKKKEAAEPASAPAAVEATKVSPTKTPPPAAAKTATKAPAKPTEPPAEEEVEELTFSNVADLGQFDSYRMSHRFSWEWESGETESMEYLTEFVREPLAQRVVMKGSGEGEGAGAGEMELIHVEGTSYMKFGDEWMSTESSAEDLLEQGGWLGGPEGFLGSEKGRYVGRETVNGLPTRHYQYTDNILAPFGGESKITKATSDVWVSTKYDVYVKVIIRWEGTEEEKGKGVFLLESNLTDINEPITIQPPEAGERPEVPEDIPVIEGATELVLMANVITFQVTRPQEEVVEFYKAEMPANGWELGEGLVPMMMAFTKGSRSANVIVAEQDGKTAVTIMVSED